MPIIKSTTDITGTIKFFAGTTAPTGYLACDGSVVTRTAYPGLFGVIGTTYNTAGETGSDFRLPDLRGKTVLGVGQDTSRSLSNYTLGSYGGVETVTLSVAQLATHQHTATTNGASADHTHSTTFHTSDNNMSHTHRYGWTGWGSNSDNEGDKYSVNGLQANPDSTFDLSAKLDHGHTYGSGGPSTDHTHTYVTSPGNAGSNGSGGSAAAHNNIQPSMTAGFYIKY